MQSFNTSTVGRTKLDLLPTDHDEVAKYMDSGLFAGSGNISSIKHNQPETVSADTTG